MNCHMFRLPKIAVVYIYPLAGAHGFRDKAAALSSSGLAGGWFGN
jgi:uncharacterized protein YcbX